MSDHSQTHTGCKKAKTHTYTETHKDAAGSSCCFLKPLDADEK